MSIICFIRYQIDPFQKKLSALTPKAGVASFRVAVAI